MLITPVCVKPVPSNLSQLPWWRMVHRWLQLRHLPVRLYHVLGVSHCPNPAVIPTSRTSRVLQHIILWGAHPQVEAVTTGKLGCSLKQQSKGDLQNKQQEQAQSHNWHSQTSRTLGFPCCMAPAPKPILPPLKLETPISILKTDLGSWNSFSLPLPSELCRFKVLFSVFYSWSL